jgi:hypothetical protein
VPSPNFGDVWGPGQKDGNRLAAFQLIELGGWLERRRYAINIHRELREVVLDAADSVAIMPTEIVGVRRLRRRRFRVLVVRSW